jgi:hypothetical protein
MRLFYEIKKYAETSGMSDWKMVMAEQSVVQINKTELAPGVSVYSDVLPGYEQIIPYVEQVTASGMVLWEPKEIGGNTIDTMTFDYPEVLKDPNDHSILFNERISLVLGGFLGFVETDFITSNNIKSRLAHDKFMLMRYSSEAEFPKSKYTEDHLSVMYYLNDNYEGGSIEFPELGISYQPKANDALIFTSAPGFEYTVAKVTSGTKYSVLSYLK